MRPGERGLASGPERDNSPRPAADADQRRYLAANYGAETDADRRPEPGGHGAVCKKKQRAGTRIEFALDPACPQRHGAHADGKRVAISPKPAAKNMLRQEVTAEH